MSGPLDALGWLAVAGLALALICALIALAGCVWLFIRISKDMKR